MNWAPAPVPVEVFQDNGYRGPGLWIGSDDEYEYVVDTDGHVQRFELHTLTISWRFDWRVQEWIEVGDEEAVDDDGGAQLSRSVLDVDGAGAGDPLDEEGQSSPGGSGSLDTTEGAPV